jgi:hypothetical protein
MTRPKCNIAAILTAAVLTAWLYPLANVSHTYPSSKIIRMPLILLTMLNFLFEIDIIPNGG